MVPAVNSVPPRTRPTVPKTRAVAPCSTGVSRTTRMPGGGKRRARSVCTERRTAPTPTSHASSVKGAANPSIASTARPRPSGDS